MGCYGMGGEQVPKEVEEDDYKRASTIVKNATALLGDGTNDRAFKHVMGEIQTRTRRTRPGYPDDVIVAEIPPIPEAEQEEFKQKYINNHKTKKHSPEGQKRRADQVENMYARWNWACKNVETMVNCFRLSGHSDEVIQNMFNGVPMCFDSMETFTKFCDGLRALAPKIENEMGWRNVHFIMTGSSVVGFSMNPLKGFEKQPSKITSATSSDVDISILGEGVNDWWFTRTDTAHLPGKQYPTVASRTVTVTRFGIDEKDGAEEFSEVITRFKNKWGKVLDGGVQFTFCENAVDNAPWEICVGKRDLGAVGAAPKGAGGAKAVAGKGVAGAKDTTRKGPQDL